MWRRRQRFTSLVCHSSLVSLFFTSVMFCSSSKSLLPHFIDPSTLTVCTRDIWNVVNIVLAVRTRDVRNHDRLEWLPNRISSFSQSVHAMYETMTDLNGFSIIFNCSHSLYTRRIKPWQTTASVGLAQARPNYSF